MKLLLLALVVALNTLQPVPQSSSGVLSGRITRLGTTEGIASVQITLVGPGPVLQAGGSLPGYTPNAALTDGMRAQIDQLLSSAPPGIPLDVIANAAARMEAQLLGLPIPAPGLATAGGTAAPQVVGTTEADGRFIFRNLAPGRYQVRAQREGYFGVSLPGAIVPPAIVNTTATVTAGQETPELAITMLRGAIVSGRVRDPNGQPVSNLQVMAQQWAYRDGRPVLNQVNSKQTDDRGEFRLFWLPPGDYLISVNPPRPAAAPRPTDAYARTWYPNATEAQLAQRVTVAEGAEIGGLDIGIRPQGTATVSGRIVSLMVGPNGQPSLPQPTLFLIPRDANTVVDTLAPNFPNTSPNRNNGQFEIRGVPPGSYDLIATAPDSNGRPVPGRAQVDVGYSNVENVQVTIRPGVEVKARVFVDGNLVPPPPAVAGGQLPSRGAITSVVISPDGGTITTTGGVVTAVAVPPPPPPPPPPPAAVVQAVPGAGGAAIRVTLRSRESYAQPFDAAASSGQTSDASGAFVFPSVPESVYIVQVTGVPPNGYIADVREGGVSIYDSGLRVTSQPPGPVEVFVVSKGGTLEGTVLNARQQPAEGATVVLVPAASSRRHNAALSRTVRSLGQGAFRIAGVGPGDYKLFAWESIPSSAWLNAQFMTPYENQGISIRVTDASNQRADVKVIPAEGSR